MTDQAANTSTLNAEPLTPNLRQSASCDGNPAYQCDRTPGPRLAAPTRWDARFRIF